MRNNLSDPTPSIEYFQSEVLLICLGHELNTIISISHDYGGYKETSPVLEGVSVIKYKIKYEKKRVSDSLLEIMLLNRKKELDRESPERPAKRKSVF